ncbi:helix-turn-helix domain-containing protein [[Clostridium] polysaccharolyticum]|uniref:Transcriptional regulator, contains XRE-family HTH domain n=1 Tax=[Clostridium] polysaccharolyticum TaxID=29364 RepID=A0A1H9YB59_9FIRM|nr:helix-turn-helix domain-containing protein [[Clostridium] polysaccharolyticum]SES65661.1 Transcriptional regulator, contains XRE-family HTH domain [[Clostridium] polysaccharolyticum]
MANKKFGETLQELRLKKGYTQKNVAELLGLKNKSTVSSWEVGKSEPDGYTLLKLLKLYDVTNVYEAFGEVTPRPHQINEKYNKLNSNYKKLVENQIDQLLDIQNKH